MPKTIYAVAFQDDSAGGVDWNTDEGTMRELFKEYCDDSAYASKDVVLFSFDVGVDDPDIITSEADVMMVNMPAKADTGEIREALEDAGFDGFVILGVRQAKE